MANIGISATGQKRMHGKTCRRKKRSKFACRMLDQRYERVTSFERIY
jgi:hypothetical protein